MQDENQSEMASSPTHYGQLFMAGQGLASVTNKPHRFTSTTIFGGEHQVLEQPPTLMPGVLPDVQRSDFNSYLKIIDESYRNYAYSRQKVFGDKYMRLLAQQEQGGQGKVDGLATALKHVPQVYFSEDLDITRPEVFADLVRREGGDHKVVIERLSGYLENVEYQLLQEIAARSDSFFEAAGVLNELRHVASNVQKHVSQLRQQVRGLDDVMAQNACKVAQLRDRRKNLIAVLELMQLIDETQQALYALNVLLRQGDYPLAIDMLTQLQNAAPTLSQLAILSNLQSTLDTASRNLNDMVCGDLMSIFKFSQLDSAVEAVFWYMHDQVQARSRAENSASTKPKQQPSQTDMQSAWQNNGNVALSGVGNATTGSNQASSAVSLASSLHGSPELSVQRTNVSSMLKPMEGLDAAQRSMRPSATTLANTTSQDESSIDLQTSVHVRPLASTSETEVKHSVVDGGYVGDSTADMVLHQAGNGGGAVRGEGNAAEASIGKIKPINTRQSSSHVDYSVGNSQYGAGSEGVVNESNEFTFSSVQNSSADQTGPNSISIILQCLVNENDDVICNIVVQDDGPGLQTSEGLQSTELKARISKRLSANQAQHASSPRVQAIFQQQSQQNGQQTAVQTYTRQQRVQQVTDTLLPVVWALSKLGQLTVVLDKHVKDVKQSIVRSLDVLLETSLPFLLLSQYESEEQTIDEQGLHGKLQSLHNTELVIVLEGIDCLIDKWREHIEYVGELLQAVASQVDLTLSQKQYITQSINDLQGIAVEQGQVLWQRILTARAQVVPQLDLTQLSELQKACDKLMDKVIASGYKVLPLFKTAISMQGRGYLQEIHSRGMAELGRVLVHEKWVACQVPQWVQNAAQYMHTQADTSSDKESPDQSSNAVRQFIPSDMEAPPSSSSTPVPQHTHLIIGIHQHSASASMLALVQILARYVQLRGLVPQLGADVAHRALALIQKYNQRTCQLVLGGEALESGALKNITAKNLAIVVASISCLQDMFSTIKDALYKGIGSAQRTVLQPEFFRLEQDLELHKDELQAKIIVIMKDRLQSSIENMLQDGEQGGNTKSGGLVGDLRRSLKGSLLKHKEEEHTQPTDTVLVLCKQLSTLVLILKQVLLDEDMQSVLQRVALLYSSALTEGLRLVQAGEQCSLSQLLCDAAYLLNTVERLPMRAGVREQQVKKLRNFVEELNSASVLAQTADNSPNQSP